MRRAVSFLPAGVAAFVLAVMAAAAWSVMGWERSGAQSPYAEPPQEPPFRIGNFRLHDHEGGSHELRWLGDYKALVLFYQGNGCPNVRQHIPRVKALRDEYEPEGVKFLMINANLQDDRESVAEEAADYGVDMPILLDRAQSVTRMLGTERTNEALLIDLQRREVVYRGAVDDRIDFGAARNEAEAHWLQDAIEAFLAGDPIETAHTEALGCLITQRPAPEEVTYVDDIAPILAERCITCHSPGRIAPFAFTDYDSAAGWSSMTREVILTKRMPPWHADPHFGVFGNDRSLTPDEERKLLAWIEAGAPRGEGDDPLAEMDREDNTEWRLGEPDHVVDIGPPVDIPAEGVLDYVYRIVPSGIGEERWVRAMDVRPGDAEVVHHVLVFTADPEDMEADLADLVDEDGNPRRGAARGLEPLLHEEWRGGLDGFFAAYIPGDQAMELPEGTGKRLPANALLVFQLHYNVTGRETSDQTEMAFYFHDEPPDKEVETRGAYTTQLRIPPNARGHEAEASHTVDRDVLLWEVNPHMHYRGSRFEYTAVFPDGREEVLLSVPNYDFDWQTSYRFEEPVFLPAGTEIRCKGAYDNSEWNPANPDPSQTVTFGEQSFDEMFVGYVSYSEAPSEYVERYAENVDPE